MVHTNIKINLNEMVTDSSNSVFSNYIIAKSQYWKQWKYLAEKFFEFTKVEQIEQTKNAGKFYNGYPMTVFIQERFPAIIMSLIKLPTVNIDLSNVAPINSLLFDDNIQTRIYLRECDQLKKKYNQTKDHIFLNEYQRIRNKIWFKNQTL